MTEKQNPTESELMKIALDGSLSLSTVRKVYKGGGHKNSRKRVKEIAKKLNFPIPIEVDK